jgi:hypothetical protein
MSIVANVRSLFTVLTVASSLLLVPVAPVLGKGPPDLHDHHPQLKVTVGRPLPPGVPLPRVEGEVSRDRYYPRQHYERHDDGRYRYEYRRDFYRHYYRPHGGYYPSIPAGFVSLNLAGGLFYYHMGTYYRPAENGYVVVRAPFGARIRALPEGCSPLYIGDRRYFVCDEVYYQPDGEEYVVIERPARPDYRVEVGDEVRIGADFLNLRSGPGQQHRVVGQLYRGDVVEVCAIEGDWYSIVLANGVYGWIKGEFATLYRAREEVKG